MNRTPTPAPPRPLGARALRALIEFFRIEAASGVMLILAALLALLCANSMLAEPYEALRMLPVQARIGALDIDKPLLLWINDGLMAVFFLLVALEIKREALTGQLSSPARMALPMVCACAGVAVPALLYTAVNHGDPLAMRGWAVPAATDIAFALGVLALLGSRAPLGMKVLLSTIAVVDDLIAIVIIALFYTEELSMGALAWAGAALAGMLLLNRRGVRALSPYLLLGLVLWVCVLKSGVHATLAGVATGLLIPHGPRRARDDADSPLETLEHTLHPWVAFAILPLFSFVNAGLSLRGLHADDMLSPVPLGIALGLVLGKPIGIVGAAMLMRAARLAPFPEGMDNRAMLGMGMLCGIGFTMSLFISGLAFSAHPLLYDESVLGVLLASTVSAVVGMLWLRAVLPRHGQAGMG
jgi:NhaA family Na+:H+ antiporter